MPTTTVCPILALMDLRWDETDRYNEFFSTIPNEWNKEAFRKWETKTLVANKSRAEVLEERENFDEFPLLSTLPIHFVDKRENRIRHQNIQVRLYGSLAVVNMAELEE